MVLNAALFRADPLVQAIRASADVIEVDASGGLLASVYLAPGSVAVARLSRELHGSPHHGRILHEAMLATAGCYGYGLFVWGIESPAHA